MLYIEIKKNFALDGESVVLLAYLLRWQFIISYPLNLTQSGEEEDIGVSYNSSNSSHCYLNIKILITSLF